MSNFAFLTTWPELKELAQQAESLVYVNPRGACFYTRYTLERAVKELYRIDKWLKKPYDDNLSTLIHESTFRNGLGSGLFPKLKTIQKVGNRAAHSESKITEADALHVVRELHHFLYWLDKTYSDHTDKTVSNQVFDGARIPKKVLLDYQLALNTAKKLKDQEKTLADKDKAAAKKQQALEASNEQLMAALETLREQVAQAKAANEEAAQALPDTHDYNEADTRKFLIDEYLREVGWDLSKADSVSAFAEEVEKAKKAGVSFETEVAGMPSDSGVGFVDYVLWSEDHQPLAVIEAKRTSISPKAGERQAELYADCLEKEYGQRPLIYCTNGYEILFWDDTQYPSRPVQGFRSRDELQLLIDRRSSQLSIAKAPVNKDIADRYYQEGAVRSITEQFENHHQRKTLLVMATGTGKTRTSMALVDMLLKHNWVKNVLFLADRNALLSQAKKAFSYYLPRTSPTILSAHLTPADVNSRLCFSTYPTMMSILNEPAESRLFSTGHFDLVIVDEAHRSVYKKYKTIFEYFDSLLVGLTATPKSDIDKNTYDIFELESGVPTYAYELETAIADGCLVPPKCLSVPLKFMRRGVKKHKDLTEEEKEQWDEEEALEDRDEVLPSELNSFLFNNDTTDKMLEVLMRKGVSVSGGDVLGKTIIFAANNDHAHHIQERFDQQYPKWKGHFARVITYKEKYAESLIDEFKETTVPRGQVPLNIAISVDMLDTGIDVPEVVNLVFFKVVHSKVKFLQMVGRGTRLCEGLFGPKVGENADNDKQYFKVFDYCQNFEFFEQNPDGAADPVQKSLSQLVFEKRLSLSQGLSAAEGENIDELRTYVLDLLHHQVAGMKLDNFIVRPKRECVERYQSRADWDSLSDDQFAEVMSEVAALPTEADALNGDEEGDELAKRFDHQCLQMQLALLDTQTLPQALCIKVKETARKLEEKHSIPMVAEHLDFLQRIQTNEFWEYITLSCLETMRVKLRKLMQFLDKKERSVVYTSFEDTFEGDIKEAVMPSTQGDLEQYHKKVATFVRDNESHITIQRLKRNKPVTQQDLEQLEEMLFKASGIDDKTRYDEVVHKGKPVGVFIRSLTGLDTKAAKEAFSGYLDDALYNSVQIEFINTIIGWLCQNGTMEPAALYDPPFINYNDDSVFGLFDDDQAHAIVDKLKAVNDAAYPVGEAVL